MAKIKILTDSTSDLSPAMAEQYGIEVIPLTVTVAGQSYRDGIDISPDQFYPLLTTAKELPKTSPLAWRLHTIRERMELVFSLDTLRFLEKGGRIGKVSALLGSLLNIKPLIRVDDGIYVPFGKTRSQSQALERFVQFMQEKVGSQPVRVAVGHGRALQAGQRLKEMVEHSLHITGDVTLFEVGPVIGVHTGPGTIGAAFYPV